MDETLDEFEDDGTEDTSLSVTPKTGGAGVMPGLSNADAMSVWSRKQTLADKQAQANLDLLVRAQNDLRTQRVGPSESEKWLALAAALGQPTKTGAFGESLGNAAQALGKYKSAAREAEETRKSMLEKYGLEIGNERYKMLQGAANQAGQVYRSVAAANKPRVPRAVGVQTIGGKLVAVSQDPDSGEYIKTVLGDAPTDLKPTKETFGGQPVFMQGNKLVLADGSPVGKVDVKPKELTATEQRELFDTEDAVNSGLSALSSIQQALGLNNQAYEGSLSGWRKTVGQLFSSDDPRYVATETFDNVVQTSALRDLKAMFGTNPTEGERKIFLELQAISSKPRAVRDQILRRAEDAMKRRIARDTKRLEGLKGGDYSSRGGSDASSTRVIRFDKKGNRI